MESPVHGSGSYSSWFYSEESVPVDGLDIKSIYVAREADVVDLGEEILEEWGDGLTMRSPMVKGSSCSTYDIMYTCVPMP